MTTTFIDHTPATAPAGAAAVLEATQRKFGFIPAAAARMAESPALSAAFGRLLGQFEASALGPVEREVLATTVGVEVGCGVCVALHSASLTRLAPELVGPLRARRPIGDPRLEAVRLFVLEVLRTRGAVDDAGLDGFLAAGFDRRQALDVVLGVGLYVMSTYANRLTRAPLDPPFEPFRWEEAQADRAA